MSTPQNILPQSSSPETMVKAPALPGGVVAGPPSIGHPVIMLKGNSRRTEKFAGRRWEIIKAALFDDKFVFVQEDDSLMITGVLPKQYGELMVARERLRRCENSVLAAMIELPNVASYIATIEKDREDAQRERDNLRAELEPYRAAKRRPKRKRRVKA